MSQTLAEFNPYRELLDIPTHRQSLTHYRLLGVSAFEDDPTVIEEAARRRLDQLQPHRDGAYPEECRCLEREIEVAAACLMDPSSREAYEQEQLHSNIMRPTTREAFQDGDGSKGQNRVTGSPAPVGNSQGLDAPGTREDSVAGGTDSGSGFPGHPNYEITRQVARGRHSIVFQAYDRALRRYVAIKELDEAFCRDPRSTETFWEEARFLANFRHPNIVTVHAVSESRRWIIMELMGDNLKNRIADRPMPADLVRSVLRQALEGLAYLHGQGKLHGQVGLANLLIDEAGHVKLSASPGYTAAGEFPAPDESQRHVAPELLNPGLFGAVGTGIDLYCLGFAMLELLTGPKIDRLFKGVKSGDDDTALCWMRWHNSPSETLPPVKELVPSMPDDLARVIDRLVQKPVDARYASAQQALDDLDGGPFVAVPSQANSAPAAQRNAAAAPPKSGPGAVCIGTPPDLHRPMSYGPGAASRKPASDSPLERMGDRRFWSGLLEKPAFAYSIGGAAVVVVLAALLLRNPPTTPTEEPVPDPPSKGVAEDERGKKPVSLVEESESYEVWIDTNPAGSVVLIDGERKGTAPGRFRVTSGRHIVEVNHEGYQGEKKRISGDDDGRDFYWALRPIETPTLTNTKPPVTQPGPPEVVIGPPTPPLPPVPPQPPRPVQPPRMDIPTWTHLATPLPEPVVVVLERILLTLDRVETPTTESLEECIACGLHDEDVLDPVSEYMYALVYYHHGTFDGNREKAKLHLDAAMDRAKEPFFAPWRLRIWMHLQEKEWEQAVSLCLRLLDQLNAYPPEDARTVEANVYFVACTVGFIQGLAERKAIAFGQFNVWIQEELRTIDPRFCGLYKEQRLQLAQFVRDLPAERVVKLGELRDNILMENLRLPMSPRGLEADLRRALRKSETDNRVASSALDR